MQTIFKNFLIFLSRFIKKSDRVSVCVEDNTIKHSTMVAPEVKPFEVIPVEQPIPIIPDAMVDDDYKPVTSSQLTEIVPSVQSRADEFTDALNSAMKEFSINTPLRQAMFIAQTIHESMGYSHLVENLNYSAQALMATWPNRFNREKAAAYARQPEKIANCAYCNRMGNGDESSGDGWKYKGRGIMQITGKDNYRACGTVLGIDLVNSPELLEKPEYAFRSAGWFWDSRKINSLADTEDFIAVTKKINGGTNGLEDRQKYFIKAKTVLGIA